LEEAKKKDLALENKVQKEKQNNKQKEPNFIPHRKMIIDLM